MRTVYKRIIKNIFYGVLYFDQQPLRVLKLVYLLFWTFENDFAQFYLKLTTVRWGVAGRGEGGGIQNRAYQDIF